MLNQGRRSKEHLQHLSAQVAWMQDSWLSVRVDDIQGYVDKNDMKNFYCSLNKAYRPTSAGFSSFLRADRTKLILEKNKILVRWDEHFDGVLNKLSTIRPLNDCRKSQVMSHSMSLQPKGNFRYLSVNYPVAKQTDLTQFLRKSIWRVLFTNPSARAGYDTRSIFKRSLTGLNSEFSFS